LVGARLRGHAAPHAFEAHQISPSIFREFGFGQTSDYDRFLLLDDFRNDIPEDYLAGVRQHPHRGIVSTLT